MIHFLASQFRDWDHKVTSGMGLAVAVMPSIDGIGHLLGVVALATGVYCSISRELRERRAERQRRHRCQP